MRLLSAPATAISQKRAETMRLLSSLMERLLLSDQQLASTSSQHQLDPIATHNEGRRY